MKITKLPAALLAVLGGYGDAQKVFEAAVTAIEAGKSVSGVFESIEAVWESLKGSDFGDEVMALLSDFEDLIGDDYEKIQEVLQALIDNADEVEKIYTMIKGSTVAAQIEALFADESTDA